MKRVSEPPKIGICGYVLKSGIEQYKYAAIKSPGRRRPSDKRGELMSLLWRWMRRKGRWFWSGFFDESYDGELGYWKGGHGDSWSSDRAFSRVKTIVGKGIQCLRYGKRARRSLTLGSSQNENLSLENVEFNLAEPSSTMHCISTNTIHRLPSHSISLMIFRVQTGPRMCKCEMMPRFCPCKFSSAMQRIEVFWHMWGGGIKVDIGQGHGERSRWDEKMVSRRRDKDWT